MKFFDEALFVNPVDKLSDVMPRSYFPPVASSTTQVLVEKKNDFTCLTIKYFPRSKKKNKNKRKSSGEKGSSGTPIPRKKPR